MKDFFFLRRRFLWVNWKCWQSRTDRSSFLWWRSSIPLKTRSILSDLCLSWKLPTSNSIRILSTGLNRPTEKTLEVAIIIMTMILFLKNMINGRHPSGIIENIQESRLFCDEPRNLLRGFGRQRIRLLSAQVLGEWVRSVEDYGQFTHWSVLLQYQILLSR